MRFIFVLALMALGSMVTAQERMDLSDTERAQFRNEIRAYLLENPEVLQEAIAVLEQRQVEAQMLADIARVEENLELLENDGFSYVGGNPDGDITIVEFLDYQCAYCKRAHPTVHQLLASDPNIRLVVKEFPILGPASTVSAAAALAVLEDHGPETYAEFSDKLMSFNGQLTPSIVSRFAQDSGIDVEQMLARADSPEIKGRIDDTRALAASLDLTGTPSFIIGNSVQRGFLPLNVMQELVRQQRNDG